MNVTAAVELVLVRHGQTCGNAERRYVGSKDNQPLSPQGREQAMRAGIYPDVERVYVSSLIRTQETARIMFPNARQEVVEGIQEMDFGAFTGRSADEMADDADYRAWVATNCEGPCPEGESKAEFDERVCRAMEQLVRDAASRGERRVVMVVHGGTMMAFLSAFSNDSRNYYEWLTDNCQGWRMQVAVAPSTIDVSKIQLLQDASPFSPSQAQSASRKR